MQEVLRQGDEVATWVLEHKFLTAVAFCVVARVHDALDFHPLVRPSFRDHVAHAELLRLQEQGKCAPSECEDNEVARGVSQARGEQAHHVRADALPAERRHLFRGILSRFHFQGGMIREFGNTGKHENSCTKAAADRAPAFMQSRGDAPSDIERTGSAAIKAQSVLFGRVNSSPWTSKVRVLRVCLVCSYE